MQTVNLEVDLYLHVRVLLSVILGLSVTRLLAGLTTFIQHPRRHRVWWIHMGWVCWTLFNVIAFWWWEFRLSTVAHWTFILYGFVCLYSSVFYFLSALLFPNDLEEYRGYEDYFLSRRRWFFGFVAFAQALDFIDTWIKGEQYLSSFGPEYLARTALFIMLCAVAAYTRNRSFHVGFVVAALAYDFTYSIRYFSTMS